MHEYGISTALVEAVTARAASIGARRVVAIHLAVGERAGIAETALRSCFDLVSADTPAAGARLALRRRPLVFHCAACEADYAVHGDAFACPSCGAYGALVDAADDLVLERIEVER